MLFTTIDVETTGLDTYNSDIIQFAYSLTNETGRVIRSECLHFYYQGIERSWSDAAYAVHGIPLQELRTHAEEFETNCKKMWIAIARANVVGYNSDTFDIPFIQRWLKRMGYPIPEPNMKYDVMKIFRQHGVRGKLVQVTESVGFTKDIVERISELNYGIAGRSHLAFYDVTETNLLLNYAISKKWIDTSTTSYQKVVDDRAERALDDMAGRVLFNDIKYYITDIDGNNYEVALCPDPDKYVYYKQQTDKPGQFKETSKGVYTLGSLCIRDTGNTITLEQNKEV